MNPVSRMMANPITRTDVSVIIPVYNGELYLAEAIDSVLSQSLPPSEIVIVDDGSTDRSPATAKRFDSAVRYFYQKNMGTAAARNRGIIEARGNFFAFLDQDDIWEPQKLEIQINAFQNDSGLDIVFGHVQQFFGSELEEEIKGRIRCPDRPEPGYLPSAMLIKRESVFRVGLFETEWKIGEWADWYVRASELGLNIRMLTDTVTRRRIHKGNKGILQHTMRKEYAQILKASLDRRRARDRVRPRKNSAGSTGARCK